jgi:hypothetical protein
MTEIRSRLRPNLTIGDYVGVVSIYNDATDTFITVYVEELWSLKELIEEVMAMPHNKDKVFNVDKA